MTFKHLTLCKQHKVIKAILNLNWGEDLGSPLFFPLSWLKQTDLGVVLWTIWIHSTLNEQFSCIKFVHVT